MDALIFLITAIALGAFILTFFYHHDNQRLKEENENLKNQNQALEKTLEFRDGEIKFYESCK